MGPVEGPLKGTSEVTVRGKSGSTPFGVPDPEPLLRRGLLLWLFRDRAPPNLPVNGLTEALYIACLLNIPAAILLTWRR